MTEESKTPEKGTSSAENTLTVESNKQRPKWLIPTIAGCCAVVVIAAGFGGYAAWSNHELAAAKASCAAASEKVRKAANEYNALLNGDAVKASAVKTDEVKDAKTVDSLESALKETAPEYTGCVADDKTGLDEAVKTLNDQADWYTKHEKTLSKAVKAVNESKAAKTLDIAKSNLKSKLDEASKLLSDSDGKVADNSTRDNLSKTIDAAKKLADGNDSTKLDKARQDVDSALKAVSDSIQAKMEADAQAAAQTAAAQAQSSSSVGSNYSRSSGSNRGYSNGGGYSRPSTSGQTAQTQQPSTDDGYFDYTLCGTSDGKEFQPC
ncbi:membrane protein involved in colicin uptake [Bifidobacterium saguini DSM 23967]|uniref:Membrane protein involved in colicin uptake n=2 Tax=Bifidobacterium saguini TaxID=762210 RepID=A0A087DCC1_9BIFI|nr:FIVAR domain-containing protein [Bifidobacterium saguini]KFI93171.1 membrane protein involved in colicin uptake [Bifidobacterium saguini DSM 23967]QTB91212.1 FIVAR domain-containing protein [Bifidobacterium saguini]